MASLVDNVGRGPAIVHGWRAHTQWPTGSFGPRRKRRGGWRVYPGRVGVAVARDGEELAWRSRTNRSWPLRPLLTFEPVEDEECGDEADVEYDDDDDGDDDRTLRTADVRRVVEVDYKGKVWNFKYWISTSFWRILIWIRFPILGLDYSLLQKLKTLMSIFRLSFFFFVKL